MPQRRLSSAKSAKPPSTGTGAKSHRRWDSPKPRVTPKKTRVGVFGEGIAESQEPEME